MRGLSGTHRPEIMLSAFSHPDNSRLHDDRRLGTKAKAPRPEAEVTCEPCHQLAVAYFQRSSDTPKMGITPPKKEGAQ